MFCVRCGEEFGDDLVGGLCRPCYLTAKEFSSLAGNVDLEVCVHCGSRRRGEIWVAPNVVTETAVHDAVLEAVTFVRGLESTRLNIEIVPEDTRNFTCTVRATGISEGVPFTEVRTTRARTKNATCQRCSRFQGNYFEAIVQVRANRREMPRAELREIRALASRTIERIVGEGDPLAYVLKDEDVHGGLDIYTGTTNAARMIVKAISSEHGGIMREHPKIAGQIDGNDVYRITFALRLPEYRVGDLVRIASGPVEAVSAVSTKNATVRDLFTGKPRTVARDILDKALVLKRADAREAVVVSRSGKELQILDPWTFATCSIIRPDSVGEDDAGILVVKLDEELYPVPK